MEPTESQYESPVLECKAKKELESDTLEKAHEVVFKKRVQRTKQKLLEKEMIVDSSVKDIDAVKNVPQKDEFPVDGVHSFNQTEITNNKTNENGKCDVSDESSIEHPKEETAEIRMTEENVNFEEMKNVEKSIVCNDEQEKIVDVGTEKKKEEPQNCNGESQIVETECSANYKNSKESDNDERHEKITTEVNGVADSSPEVQDITGSEAVEMVEIPLNGSDEESFYETVELAKEVKASPDTATEGESSFTHKISSLLGKWQTQSFSPVKENKQDTEITSSGKAVPTKLEFHLGVSHPYLSKVTGRRGIKTRANVNGVETPEMPKNKGTNLSDSFRVKTDPPRLSQAEIGLESVLRKYKGKRCLNINDDEDDEGEENGYGNGNEICPISTKRRKLEEKTSNAGFLGNVLWSPFKKSEEKAITQSKLSRFLSPFWFWKKTTTYRERK